MTLPIVILCLILLQTVNVNCKPAIPLDENNNDEDCHPTPQNGKDVYIVAYGSLMSTDSKSKTYPDTGPNIPVEVKGFSRKFNCKGTPVGLSTTFLGVDVDPDGHFNGAVFKISNNESLFEFDKRELYYCRKEVHIDELQFLINSSSGLELPSNNSQFWIYDVKPEFHAFPSKRFPIVQSYVDIFVIGCLELENSFKLISYADKCFNSTDGWNYPWINDRLLPRRPFVYQPKAYSIDSFLDKHLPGISDRVYQEMGIGYKTGDDKSGARRNGWEIGKNLLLLFAYCINGILKRRLC